MNTTWIWLGAVAVLILGGAWFLFMGDTPKSTDLDVAGVLGDTEGVSAEEVLPNTAAVSYDGVSFTTATVTIKKGGTVTWNGTSGMWVASDEHPTHAVYDGTARSEHCPNTTNAAFDQCARGASYSFTFTKVGEWDYHDHANASAGGFVVVTE